MPYPVAPIQPPAPSAPPALPQGPKIDLAASALSGASPVEVLRAARAERSELQRQVDRLEDKRNELIRELRRDETPGEAKPGIELRLKDVEARIIATENQIAAADQSVARATAVPGSTVPEPPPPERNGPPDEVFIIPIVFTIFVLCPIAIAYARRIWKRGATIIAPVPQEVRDRMDRMHEAIDSIAVEVERIGEGQRFVTKVMSESSRALGAGAAQPIGVPQGEKIGVLRDL